MTDVFPNRCGEPSPFRAGRKVSYRHLFYKIHGRLAKPMIICRRARNELKEAAWMEQGIEVVEVQ